MMKYDKKEIEIDSSTLEITENLGESDGGHGLTSYMFEVIGKDGKNYYGSVDGHELSETYWDYAEIEGCYEDDIINEMKREGRYQVV